MPATHTPSSKQSWLANQPLQRKIALGISLLLALFLLTSAVTMSSLREQQDDRQWTTHTYEVLLAIGDVRRAAQTAQIGARGYLLFQRPDQRAMFENGNKDLFAHLAQMRQLTSDNAIQQSRIGTIEAMATRWQQEFTANALNPMSQLAISDPTAAALERQRIQSNYLERRTVTIEDVQGVLDRMVAEENQLLSVRSQRLDASLRTTRITSIVAALLGLLLGFTIVRLTSRLVTRPLRRLTDLMARLSDHDHDFEIRRLNRQDEIGKIARGLQVFKQMAIDTQSQTWLKTQVSGISHRLQEATTHREFAQWLTSELVPLFNMGVGLFYSFDETRFRLDLLGSYGLRLGNPTADSYIPGEGLVGQCAIERKPIFVNDVPVPI